MQRNKLRVVSYNIHKGFGIGTGKFNLKKIREALRYLSPDVVFLQEVQGHHEVHREKIKGWPSIPQFEYLAHEIWPHYAYGKNAVYSFGHHGNAILSKYPFSFFENIDISTNSLEKRGLLHGVIDLPNGQSPLHLVCLHLGLLEAERVQQMGRLFHRIEAHVSSDDPLIVGGDFNDWRQRLSVPLAERLRVREAFEIINGRHAKTFPSCFPTLSLDRIYIRGFEVSMARCVSEMPWGQLSDHLPVLADLC